MYGSSTCSRKLSAWMSNWPWMKLWAYHCSNCCRNTRICRLCAHPQAFFVQNSGHQKLNETEKRGQANAVKWICRLESLVDWWVNCYDCSGCQRWQLTTLVRGLTLPPGSVVNVQYLLLLAFCFRCNGRVYAEVNFVPLRSRQLCGNLPKYIVLVDDELSVAFIVLFVSCCCLFWCYEFDFACWI